MGTHQETSTLKTLADAVTETAAAEKAKDGPVGTEGLDVNAAFDGGGAVVAKEKAVQTETGEVVPGRQYADSGETKENGASLSFEGEGAKKCGESNGGESDVERSSLDKKVLADTNGSLPSETQMGDYHKEGKRKMEDLCDDGRACAMETDEGNEDSFEVEHMEDHRYSVGDLVWGKIKSHPWWPGQIYDPSDASESAMKYSQKDRHLVAYFGDGSFAWCMPSQLIPFAPHFEGMSKQSTSKAFVNAVQEAVDEIGRLVELEMTCPCVPEENKNGLSRPQAMNAGVKDGVLIPDGEIGKLLSFRYEPVELLAAVANAAESLSFPSMLDFSILKGWLSAFYRERGGYALPVHRGPLAIEGLEDKNRNESKDANDFSVPIEVPIHRPHEEDSFSSAASGPGNGQAPQEDKNHHRRKQKSVAEIMAEGSGAKLQVRKRIGSGEGTNASKKQKLIVEIENDSGGSVAAQGQKRGRKKKDDISQSGEEMQESKLGRDRISDPDTNDGEGVKEVPEEISSPRERKKSKYLCPPYTTPHDKVGNLSSKKEGIEREASERKINRARMGERMTMAAGKVLESSPGMKKCNGDTVEKKVPKEKTGAAENSNCSIGKREAVGVIDVNCSVDQLLSRIQSFAVNPVGSGNSGGSIDGFFSAFRKHRYAEAGETCKDNDDNSKKKRLGGKRKSLDSGQEKLVVGKLPETGIGGTKMQEKLDDGAPKGKGRGRGRGMGDGKSSSSGVREKSTGKKKQADVRSSPASGEEVIGAGSHSVAVGEITDIGSAREKLRVMASMLEKWDDKQTSTAVISELNADIKLLFEKMKKKTAELVEK